MIGETIFGATARCTGVALAALLLACGARAAEVNAAPYSDTLLVQSTQLNVIELSLGAPGHYSVTATDLEWFDAPLQALSFGVFTPTAPIATHSGAGTLDFFSAAAGNIFLQVYAKAGGARGVGLVSLSVVPTVPLPPTLAMLGSALLAWLVASRRRSRGGLVRAAAVR